MNPLANDLETLRDWLRYAVSRFGEAELAFGHGTTNAYDEAAYLLLHALHLPLDRLEPFLDAKVTHAERQKILQLLQRRIDQRVPAAYLTHEAWLGTFRFYVDERVIIPRSYIAELLPEGLAPYVTAIAMADLPAEYRHEPRLALAGGEDGLDAVRTILAEAPRFLNPGGTLVVEVGHNRAATELSYPRVPFVWLDTATSADSVFLLKREDLVAGT